RAAATGPSDPKLSIRALQYDPHVAAYALGRQVEVSMKFPLFQNLNVEPGFPGIDGGGPSSPRAPVRDRHHAAARRVLDDAERPLLGVELCQPLRLILADDSQQNAPVVLRNHTPGLHSLSLQTAGQAMP